MRIEPPDPARLVPRPPRPPGARLRLLERLVPSIPPADTASMLLELRAIFDDEVRVGPPVRPDRAGARRRVPPVELTPTAAILAPGDAVTIRAVLPDPAGEVAWSATGGTLVTAHGRARFTAGPAPGPHAVTATSVADPRRRAVARVVIVGHPES